MADVRRRKAENRREKEELIEEVKEKFDESYLTTKHWLLIGLVYLVITFGANHLHKCLPSPKNVDKENRQFSEIRAMPILNEMSDYGWKPAGSYNCEQLTRNRVMKEIEDIKKEFKPEAHGVKYEIDGQYVDGCFDIPVADTDGLAVCYRNISNVVLRMGKLENAGKHRIAVMLNCHYDSWPVSSGGADDLSSCALMLELIRIYSTNPQFLNHDVIFLFNGAEESSLLASHGFITQHKWRHDIRAFINLEASGSGGRELLFQAGPANEWLLNSYLEAAVHPHCSVIGQEVFQSGAYPGDTDYRIFRDHGRIPGLDLAFVQNGYWWHTEFDEAKRITKGSLQRAGENVLSTLNHLLASPYLDAPAEYSDRKTVFFDFIGLFIVIYPLSLAHTINILAILTVVLLTLKQAAKNGSLFLTALFHYTIVVASLVVVVFVMAKMSIFTYGAMRWYTRHWLAGIAYGMPVIWAGLTVQSLLVARILRKNRGEYAEIIELIHLCAISGILLIFTYYNLASGFLFALQLIPLAKKILVGKNSSAWANTIITLLVTLPGGCMCIYTSEMLLSVFVPILGRTSTNPEPVCAIFVSLATFSVVLSVLGLLAKTENNRPKEETLTINYLFLVASVLLASLTILHFIAAAWPSPFNYDLDYPTTKRTQFFHVNQALYDRDGSLAVNETRFYAISHDHRGAEDIPFVRTDPDYEIVKCHYPDNPYCEIPYYFPTNHRIKEKHIRSKKIDEILKFENPAQLSLINKKKGEIEGALSLQYSFVVEGTTQITAYAIVDPGWQLVNSSLADHSHNPHKHHAFLSFTCAKPDNHCKWQFEVTIKKTDKRITDEKPLLLGVSSHYLHGKEMQSKSIKKMLKEIENRREGATDWGITASAWNVDQIYRYF